MTQSSIVIAGNSHSVGRARIRAAASVRIARSNRVVALSGGTRGDVSDGSLDKRRPWAGSTTETSSLREGLWNVAVAVVYRCDRHVSRMSRSATYIPLLLSRIESERRTGGDHGPES